MSGVDRNELTVEGLRARILAGEVLNPVSTVLPRWPALVAAVAGVLGSLGAPMPWPWRVPLILVVLTLAGYVFEDDLLDLLEGVDARRARRAARRADSVASVIEEIANRHPIDWCSLRPEHVRALRAALTASNVARVRFDLRPSVVELDAAGFEGQHRVRDCGDDLEGAAEVVGGEGDPVEHLGGDGHPVAELDTVGPDDAPVLQGDLGAELHRSSPSVGRSGLLPGASSVQPSPAGDPSVGESSGTPAGPPSAAGVSESASSSGAAGGPAGVPSLPPADDPRLAERVVLSRNEVAVDGSPFPWFLVDEPIKVVLRAGGLSVVYLPLLTAEALLSDKTDGPVR